MDTTIRQNQELLTNMEKDFHVTTTTKVGRRISNFCFLAGGKVGAVFLWEMFFLQYMSFLTSVFVIVYFDIHGACRKQRTQ